MKMENDIPLRKYPRPQFIRDSYLCLNGIYQYAFRDSDDFPIKYDGDILVPYSPESPLSGVNRVLAPHEYLFYYKEISFPKGFVKDIVIIHFEAIDQIADIYFNDKLYIHHVGGFLPFEIKIDKKDIKDINILKIRVKDYTDTSYYSRGKQKLKRGGIWYTPQSGIYMPVWAESVNNGYIEKIRYTPDIDDSSLIVNITSALPKSVVILENKEIEIENNKDVVIKIDNPHLWDIEDPYLYKVTIKNKVDKVDSYFAMRKFSTIEVDGFKRLALNNKPIFMKGVLDQGYFDKGMLTPRSYEDYQKDINLVKELGFNTIRKHIKIESPIFYHYCDINGIIVWQDMVNGGTSYKFSTIAFPLITHIHHKDTNYKKFARIDNGGRKEALEEYKETINLLYNVPSIALWTIFNEGWGQFDSINVYNVLYKLDNTRLFDHASGWHDQGISDVKSLHVYFTKVKMPKEKYVKNRSIILSECGGYNLEVKGHKFSDTNFGYKYMENEEELIAQYAKFISRDILINIPKGLSAFIYTQLSDVEDELNGFITYDREVVKVDINKIKALNDEVHL